MSINVSVFGLGYVGAVSCGCFAQDGMQVVGVDLNPAKVDLINRGQSPIVEESIGDIIAAGVAAGRLRATTDVAEAVAATDVSVVSVGTPSRANGSLDTTAVERVSEQIGQALRGKPGEHLVVVRSTVMPGTVRGIVIPALERESGRRVGEGLAVCFNPEFLRESTSVKDHYEPPFTLIGAMSPEDAQRAAALYAKVAGETFVVSIETAEMVKYVCNAFHALKITFANEIGLLSRALGIDGREVMDLVCRDTKLNISRRYLRPGFAFGGSCLPKDVRALAHSARQQDVDVPLVNSLLESNHSQVRRAVKEIVALGKRRVSLLGLAFKAGTDDLRESPLVEIAESLIGKGFDLRTYDSHVSIARLVGANRQYIEKEIPHISSLLLPDLPQAVAHGEVLVIGNAAPELFDLAPLVREGQIVVDLVGVNPAPLQAAGCRYLGVGWHTPATAGTAVTAPS